MAINLQVLINEMYLVNPLLKHLPTPRTVDGEEIVCSTEWDW